MPIATLIGAILVSKANRFEQIGGGDEVLVGEPEQTFDKAVKAGYLWSPKTDVRGDINLSYENMTQVRSGDAVFAFASTRIKAIAIVSGAHYPMDRPEEFKKTEE